MRVLLDEDLPLGLVKHLTPHESKHVTELGWSGKSNGELLRLAVAERFDVLLTGDAHLRYQQDLRQHDIAVIELRPRRLVLQRLLELLPEMLATIEAAPKRTITSVSGER